jgi:predicted glycoside hydrolase/deacetylase ChbG (UPF0249 family)
LNLPARVLIVNADDFGRTSGVNSGIAKSHEHGIVTSASLMVRWPAAAQAAEYARSHPALGVGLHFDFGEWEFRDGQWVCVDEVVPLDLEDAVEAEVRGQLESFRSLFAGDPTHLDSHQHIHKQAPLVEASLERLAGELRVHLRRSNSHVRYCGDFYGQTATGVFQPDVLRPERLVEIVKELPPGITELGCHPGEGPDIDSPYREERELEVTALCDARVRAAIEDEGIALCSFADIELELAP